MELEKVKNKVIQFFDWKARWQDLKKIGAFLGSNGIFLVVLFVYSLRGILNKLVSLRWIGKFFVKIKTDVLIKKLTDLMYWVDRDKNGGVKRSYLIKLAFKNMKSKKNRAIVTIGGVAVGVGAIVFLVSIGYGLEKLVISKVAKLDELKMADVTLGKSMTIKLNDETVNKVGEMEGVSDVIPVVSMVSKVRFNNSILDVMSFGVNEKYLEAVDPVFIKGDEFKDKDSDFAYNVGEESRVLGIERETVWIDGKEIESEGVFDFNINEEDKVMVYEECDEESEFLGYMVRSEGGYLGEFVWGEYYLDFESEEEIRDIYLDKEYSKWVRSKVPLWMVSNEDLVVPRLDRNGQHKWELACVRADKIKVEDSELELYGGRSLDEILLGGEVLGDSDEASASASTDEEASGSAELSDDEGDEEESILDDEESEVVEASTSAELFGSEVATDSAGVEWVELRKGADDPNRLKEVEFLAAVAGEAYISTGMLRLLSLTEDEAVGQTFKVSYIIPDGNIKDMSGRLQSKEVDYEIKGIIEDDDSNYYYYQLSDAKKLGISVYSQLKVLTDDQNDLAGVRANIEVLGFKTDSTADTVAQIEGLFQTLRMILGLLGMIALGVASLGMFNTMTVSLLERTREVGVMKAMGMLSDEVRELFLAESMIMGVGGGFLGLLFGFTLGKILSIVLSSVSILKGQGIMNITTIPWFFVLFIMLVSFLVGMVTGWYPSKRARQISALNALRYE